MAISVDLSGVWKVRGFDGQHGVPERFCAEVADERTFIPAQVPGEIHLDLERAGWIPDCNLGLNAQSARWVEEQVWVYRTRFSASHEAAAAAGAWLVFDGLDLDAAIYLNGEEIGRHANAFVPCRLDVTGKLRAGENTLAVRIESGLYSVSDKHGSGYNPALDHLLHKRSWLRKPQYSFSWDWNPRLVNVGIWRPVRLEWTDTARLDAVTIFTGPVHHTRAQLYVCAFVDNVTGQPQSAVLRAHAPAAGVAAQEEVQLDAGVSRHDLCLDIANPRLWWPRPHGDQALYDVHVELELAGQVVDRAHRRTGIRSVRINQKPHPDEGDYFILEVNGRPIFAKGGNWVPPDMIYARPDAERYRRLVHLAAGANFNALRIWGGGLYADHALLDACDELGVLVWHDFIFACSKYPGDDPQFLDSVRREVTHVVRDLSAHPSLLVWCGNNELEWGAWDWGYDRGRAYPDYALYHHEIPRIVKREDPSRPYWPSSPYSTRNRPPNDPSTGDQHPWHVSLGESGPDFWKYRGDVSRFPNEGGVPGASSPATLRQFLPEDQRHVFSWAWEFHDNACNYWNPAEGICYQYLRHWLGCTPDEMAFDDYVFYSAVLQSEGLQEYVNNFRRRMFNTSSAIFWMYNDSWPTSHGWTIVDYYLRRKLAYHPVRRAFAPVHVIPVIMGDRVLIFGVNDTAEPWQGDVRHGLFQLAGGLPMDETAHTSLPPNASTPIAEFPLSRCQRLGAQTTGVFATLSQGGRPVAQNRVFIAPFKDLKWAEPEISMERREGRMVFSSPVFVWAVCLDLDGEAPLADDVFDLLPGIEYEVEWPADRAAPQIQRSASPLAWRPRA